MGKKLKPVKNAFDFITREFVAFLIFVNAYSTARILFFSKHFELNKNRVVKNILIKRGKRNRLFLHVSTMGVLFIGVLISPYLSTSTAFSQAENLGTTSRDLSVNIQSITSDDVFKTEASQKPRDKIIEYRVQKGDTLSTIAERFGISQDTIRWENNLSSDSLSIDQSLKILPVTGVAHKVASGETVYSIAKKYGVDPQVIVDFPFNDFANPQTFSLVEGQILIVPNGVIQQQAAPVVPHYYATGPVVPIPVGSSGFSWPVHGVITQYFSWYHKAVDIAAPYGTPILAAQNGHVAEVFNSGWNYGYGIHVVIAGDNGLSTLYAHMRATNVSAGEAVTAGTTVIGWIGLTGRTTGPHVHFEIRGPGNQFFNPLSYLQ